MKHILFFSLILLLPFALFSQNKNIDGKWQFIAFNGQESDLTIQKQQYCFWCQLDQANNVLTISKGKLNANLNGDDLTFDVELKGKELILKRSQLVHIELNGEKMPDQNPKSFTNYTFIRGGKTLTLTNPNSQTKEVYTFKLIK